MHIDGSTKLVGVFGSPITHTASPAMHNAAFGALKMNWAYLALHVEPPNLRAALHGARDMGFAGLNLTVPHKILALDFIDEIDPVAKRLGAVNTIHFVDGKLRGFNTDGHGIAAAIKEEFNITLKGRRVLVLGAGGAGRAIAVQCALDGATKLFVANRTAAKVAPIAREIKDCKVEFQAIGISARDITRVIGDVDLVINATSVGLSSAESLPISSEMFSAKLCVFDTIYRPAQTELLRVAAAAGARVANGLSMLLHQGAKSFEIWTQRKAPLPVMRRALRANILGEAA